MPNAIGIAGGLPGSAISIARASQTDIKQRIAAGDAARSSREPLMASSNG
jgi:hypothetical protein